MHKVLLVAPSWIGDTILAQPLFARLHEMHPGLALDAFAPAWAAPVLARMREVRRVIPNPFAHGEFNLSGRWRAGRELAREGYDAAIVLPNSWKSALLPFFAGIPQRIGFKGEARHLLLNRIHRLDEKALPQLAQRYALLAEDAGTTMPAPLAEPELAVDPDSVRATLSALGLVWAVSRFSPDRLAGVMAPMFVVASGSVACSIPFEAEGAQRGGAPSSSASR